MVSILMAGLILTRREDRVPIGFGYLLCDLDCPQICDTAAVFINVDCLLENKEDISYGFDPYRGELFDPLWGLF